MKKPESSSLLVGRWMHSHEEDDTETTVYRPADFDFPPSRGRRGFELKPDGTLVSLGIGPTDRRTESEGSWTLSDDGALELSLPGAESSRVLELESLTPDRLVVRKPPAE